MSTSLVAKVQSTVAPIVPVAVVVHGKESRVSAAKGSHANELTKYQGNVI